MLTLIDTLRDEGHGTTTVDPGTLSCLPSAAARWLSRVVPAGLSGPRTIELAMDGDIRLGHRWHRFRAREVLVPEQGFVWAARCRLAGLPVRGHDAYVDGLGSTRWQLLGVPVVSAEGPDVSLSARQRLAAESVLLPPSLVGQPWSNGATSDTACFMHQGADGDVRVPVTIQVAENGRLERVSLRRWSDPGGGRFALHEFSVDFDAEFVTAEGFRIPDAMTASWPDHGGEFWRARIVGCTLGNSGGLHD